MKFLTTEEITNLFGIDAESIDLLGIKSNKDSLYDSAEVARAYANQSGGEALDRKRESALLTRAKRLGLELINDVADGEQVPTEPIFDAMSETMATLARDFSAIRLRIISRFPETSHHVSSDLDKLQRQIQNRVASSASNEVFECS